MIRSTSMISPRQGVRHIRVAIDDVLASYGVTDEPAWRAEVASNGNLRLDDKVLAEVGSSCAVPACTT